MKRDKTACNCHNVTYGMIEDAYKVGAGEKFYIVIAIGYGKTQGAAHKNKAEDAVSAYDGTAPDWFRNGAPAKRISSGSKPERRRRSRQSRRG